MRSGVPWAPIPKTVLRALLRNERPPFSKEAAFVSLQLDFDQHAECSIAGYAKLWGWSRGKVRRFLDIVGAAIVYPDAPASGAQNGHLMLHPTDTPPPKNGQPKLLNSSGLEIVTDTTQRKNGHPADIRCSSTRDPIDPKDKNPMVDFEIFWGAYPRKQGKQAAIKAWLKLKPAPDLQAAILEALKGQAATEQWQRDGGQFIPHAATWLNGRRWEDEINSQEQQQTQPVSDPRHQKAAAEVARQYGLA